MMSPSWDWPGSRWWRVDLHAHSPESYDFKCDSGKDSLSWMSWVSAANDAGIHAIAVTDHNTADAVSHLQQVVPDMKVAPVLFPGVELTASDGTHLLLLLDPRSTQQHVEEILSRSGIHVDQRGKKGRLVRSQR